MVNYFGKLLGKLTKYFPTEFISVFKIGVIVAMFYFAIRNLNKVSELIVKRAAGVGRELVGHEIGVLLMFFAMLILIYFGYHHVWYNRYPEWGKISIWLDGLSTWLKSVPKIR